MTALSLPGTWPTSWRDLLWPRPLLARAVLYGVLGDFLTTALGVSLFGVGVENNPLMAGVMSSAGLAGFGLFKLLVLAFCLAVWACPRLFDPEGSRVERWAHRASSALTHAFLWMALVVGLALTLNNLASIAVELVLGV